MVKAVGAGPPLSGNGARGGDRGLTLSDILAVFRRRMRLIALIGFGGAALAAAGSTTLPRTYEAAAVVAIDDAALAFQTADGQPGGGGETAASKVALITSRPLLGRVVEEFRLVNDPLFNPPSSPSSWEGELSRLAAFVPREWLFGLGLAAEHGEADDSVLDRPLLARDVGGVEPSSAGSAGVNEPSSGQDVAVAAQLSGRDVAIDRLRARLSVTQPAGTELLKLSIRANEPAKAADVANAVAMIYVSWEKELRRGTARDAAGLMRERLDLLQDEVQEAERAVAEFRLEHGLAAAGLAAGTSLNDQRVLELQAQLVAVRGEQVAKQEQLQRALAARSRGGAALADLNASAPIILSLQSQEGELRRRRAELGQTYAERHPQILAVDVQIREVSQRLYGEVDRAMASIRDEVASATARQNAIERELASLQSNTVLDRAAEVQLQELGRQAAVARDRYESMLSRHRQALETADIGGSAARVVSGASMPLAPVTPGPLVVGLVGLVAFTSVGSMVAFLLEGLDRRVKSSQQLEDLLGVPSLGVLPFIQRKRWRKEPASFITEQPFNYYAESAQSIIVQIDALTGNSAPDFLLVTSALPGEGKTTLAVSLAAAFARSGLKVCVLDLDIRRPMVAVRLGRTNATLGLTDFVAGRATVDDVLHRAAQGRFDFLPTGQHINSVLPMLKSSEFTTLRNELRSRYDIVVIDSPPMLALSEVQVICKLAKHIVVAARWQHTEVAATREVIRRLSLLAPSFIGVVLTMVNIGKYGLYAQGEAGAYYHKNRKYYSN